MMNDNFDHDFYFLIQLSILQANHSNPIIINTIINKKMNIIMLIIKSNIL
jgi:hypothetical protein